MTNHGMHRVGSDKENEQQNVGKNNQLTRQHADSVTHNDETSGTEKTYRRQREASQKKGTKEDVEYNNEHKR